jgi:pimeloyl-ACP methyl ester carboxylesterase
MRIWMLTLALLLGALLTVQAQDAGTPVELTAADGLTLSGTYYATAGDAPAVLLLHQLYTTRASWDRLIQPLQEAGYRVLAVDMRGYGLTRGRINWTQAQTDAALWLEWLATQPGTQRVYTLGSSMGSSMALIACGAVESCRGAVALSPGLNYYGVSIMGPLEAAGFAKLIVYADRDRYPARAVPAIEELENASITLRAYAGRAHGVDLLTQFDDLAPALIEWLGANT